MTTNAQKIDDYVQKNPQCILPKRVDVILMGKKAELQVYRIPIELTFYNIKNGRFAAEYIDLQAKENRQLDPQNPDDSKRIRQMLLEIDPNQSKILQQDLLLYGQKQPGIITHDGSIINGNRRRASLDELVESGKSEFKYIEVGRLPPNVSHQDLWKIEAGIQLSKNIQLDYGPINELLKFKEGIDSGLTPIEVAKSLYGDWKEKDIIERLEQLKLITEYLVFLGEPGRYNRAKGVHEHFIDLRKILSNFKSQGASPDETISLKKIAFQLIIDGITTRELRKIKDILVYQNSKEELFAAIEYAKVEAPGKKIQRRIEADQNDEFTPSRTIFNNCIDMQRALSEAEQPEKLIRRALTNLESIQPGHKGLKDPNVKSMLTRIEEILNKLKK